MRSRWSAGTGPPARPSSPFTAFSRSVLLIASPLTRATTSGSCGGTGFTTGGGSSAAAGGGVACGEAGVGAAVVCGLAFAAVLREHPANITITKIDTARRTGVPLIDAVIEPDYVLRERRSTGRFSRRGRVFWTRRHR